MAKRVYARISDEMDEKLRTWAPRLGVDMSQLAGMAILSGLDNIIRAISPAESLTPEQWARIFAAMEGQGVKVEVPNELVSAANRGKGALPGGTEKA